MSELATSGWNALVKALPKQYTGFFNFQILKASMYNIVLYVCMYMSVLCTIIRMCITYVDVRTVLII